MTGDFPFDDDTPLEPWTASDLALPLGASLLSEQSANRGATFCLTTVWRDSDGRLGAAVMVHDSHGPRPRELARYEGIDSFEELDHLLYLGVSNGESQTEGWPVLKSAALAIDRASSRYGDQVQTDSTHGLPVLPAFHQDVM